MRIINRGDIMFSNFDYSNIGTQNELARIAEQLERIADILENINTNINIEMVKGDENGKYW